MALDPSAKKILDMLATDGMVDAAGLTPQQMREGFFRLSRIVDYRQAPIGRIDDGELPGPAGTLRTRSYIPQAAQAGVNNYLIKPFTNAILRQKIE